MSANTKLTMGSIPKYVKDNPNSAAVLSKMNYSRVDKSAQNRVTNPFEIPLSVNEHIKNNESIEQLFPDIKLAMQILSSSVVSPNNMISTALTYQAPNINIPTTIKQAMSERISKHIDKLYRLESKVSEIFEDAMFRHGAVVEAIIPEAAVDEVINKPSDGQVTIEQLTGTESTRLSYLGDDTAVELSTEEFGRITNINLAKDMLETKRAEKHTFELKDLCLEITDDPSKLLYGPKKLKDIGKKISREDFKFTTGAVQSDLDKLFRPNDSDRYEEAVHINTYDDTARESIGAPMVFRLPVQSVIPVHVVNDPARHLGYFVLLDERGTPLNGDMLITEDQAMAMMNNASQDGYLQSNIVNKAKNALHGIVKDDPKLSNIEEIYGEIVERAIRSKLEKGLYGEIADIKNSADIYRVMFFRALKAKKTRLLYLPAENVMYYAFEFRDNGTGRSLIEKTAMLHSIRAILLFSKVMATIKNSVTNTEVAVTLDEDDIDPQGTIERIKSQVMNSRTALAPFGVTTMKDLVDWTYKAGFKFAINGGDLPQMSVATTDVSTNKIIPDDNTDDPIKQQIIMSFGLTPEIVESGYASDFAATVVAKNLLFAKRVAAIQLVYNRLLTDHVRKLVRNDSGLREALAQYVNENMSDIKAGLKNTITAGTDSDEKIGKYNKDDLSEYIVKAFCTEIEVNLPVPELTEAQALHDAFSAYKTALDENIDSQLAPELFPEELVGALGGKVENVRNVIKSVMLRNWMMANNYMPELSEFVTIDQETKRPIFDAFGDYESFVNNLRDAMVPFLKKMNKVATANDKKLQQFGEPEGDDSFGSDTATTTTDGSETDTTGTADDTFTDDYTNPDDGSDDNTAGDVPDSFDAPKEQTGVDETAQPEGNTGGETSEDEVNKLLNS